MMRGVGDDDVGDIVVGNIVVGIDVEDERTIEGEAVASSFAIASLSVNDKTVAFSDDGKSDDFCSVLILY